MYEVKNGEIQKASWKKGLKKKRHSFDSQS